MDLRRRREESDDEESEGDDLRQLELDRDHNDQKLKNRFEHIFRKYGHDFEGVGDEIEIASGDIVVDNGHIQHMRHEADPGKSASSRFVKTFKEKLGYEDEGSSEEEDDSNEDTEDGQEDEESEDDDASETPEYRAEPGSRPPRSKHTGQLSPRRAMNAFGDLARPAPRLAHLLVGQETPQPATSMMTDRVNQDDSSVESTSGTSTPTNILSRIPGLQDSMRALQPRAKRSAVDHEAIEALGVSIANQLAQLMAGPSKSNHKKKERAKVKKSARESVWDYPELGAKPRKRRRRSQSPVEQPAPSSPAPGSPGAESLWAPEGSVRPSKRLRRGTEEAPSHRTPAVTRTTRSHLPSSGNGTSKKDVKRCWNCSLTSTPSWQTGPHGQDLCESCARYYLHHRRMKPFDSPTPSVTSEDDEEGRQTEKVAKDAHRHSRRQPKPGTVAEPIAESFERQAQGEEELDESDVRQYTQVPERPRPYFYRPIPSHVPREHASVESAPPAPVSPSRVISREPPVRPTEPLSAPQPSQHAHYSDTATQLLTSHRDRREPEPRNELSRPAPHQKAAPQPSDLQHRHRVVRAQGTPHDVQTPAPNEATGPAEPRGVVHPVPGYSANTSRTLITSPTNQAKGLFALGRFTLEEDALIIRLKEREKMTWDAITPYFPHRSPYAVSGRYSRELKFGRTPGRDYLEAQEAAEAQQYDLTDEDEHPDDPEDDPILRQDLAWNEHQDELLLELREDQELEWDEIASLLPGHSPEAVEQRYELLAERGIEQHHEKHHPAAVEPEDLALDERRARKQPRWSADEDALIVRLKEVDQLMWSQVAVSFPSRPLHSLQKRYSQRLASNVRKVTSTEKWDMISGTMEDRILAADPQLAGAAPFTQQEDQSIRRMKGEGLSWDDMAQRLPERTAKAIQHRYELKFATPVEPPPPKIPTLSLPPKVAHLPGMAVEQWDAPPLRTNKPVAPMFVHQNVTGAARSPPIPTLPPSPPKSSKPGPGSRTPFTQDEDDAILHLREMQGSSWEDIALRLPGRSVNSISSRYKEVLRPQRISRMRADVQPPPAFSPSPAQSSVHPAAQEAIPDRTAGHAQKVSPATPPSLPPAPARPISQVSTNRPRSSLPASLPSASRSQNPLLRKALDNSTRRRSDLGTVRNVSSASDNAGSQARKRHSQDPEAPSQQLFREMEMSLQTPSPTARLAKSKEQSAQRDDGQTLEKLMYAATKFAIQQKNPALFNRVKEIHDKNPNDPRLQQLLEVTSNSTISPTDVLNAFESIVPAPEPSRNRESVQSPVAPRTLKIEGGWKVATDQPLFGVLYPSPNQLSWTKPSTPANRSSEPSARLQTQRQSGSAAQPMHEFEIHQETHQTEPDLGRSAPLQLSPRRSRRAASVNASRKNAELFALPVDDLKEADSVPATTDTKQSAARRDSDGDAANTDEEESPSDSDEHEPRGRPNRAPSPPELVRQAFHSKADRAMPVQDIYALIEADHDLHGNWKSKIRAELSANPSYKRVIAEDGRPVWQVVHSVDGASPVQLSGGEAGLSNNQPTGRNSRHTNANRVSDENENDSESISVTDADNAVIVSVGPKQRRIVANAAGGRSQNATATSSASESDKSLREKTSHGLTKQRENPTAPPKTRSKTSGQDKTNPKKVEPRPAEIANSSDAEEELHLGTSLEEVDELELPTERPSSRASRDALTTSDVERDPLSSDEAAPSAIKPKSQSTEKPKAKALPSSSPIFMKPRTPASAANRKHFTPKPSSMRLSQLRKETPVRSQSPASILKRSSSVASSKRVSFGKRIVETPVRELDSDEDELAL